MRTDCRRRLRNGSTIDALIALQQNRLVIGRQVFVRIATVSMVIKYRSTTPKL